MLNQIIFQHRHNLKCLEFKTFLTFSVAASVSVLICIAVRGTPKLPEGAKAAAGATKKREASASFIFDNSFRNYEFCGMRKRGQEKLYQNRFRFSICCVPWDDDSDNVLRFGVVSNKTYVRISITNVFKKKYLV